MVSLPQGTYLLSGHFTSYPIPVLPLQADGGLLLSDNLQRHITSLYTTSDCIVGNFTYICTHIQHLICRESISHMYQLDDNMIYCQGILTVICIVHTTYLLSKNADIASYNHTVIQHI